MLNPLTYWLIMFIVAAYAYGRGKLDERLAATICVVGSVVTLIIRSPGSNYYTNVEIGVLAIDVLALFGFILLAVRSSRFWPLWVAGFQLTSVLSHFLKALHWDMIPQVYAAAERFWIYPIFLAIVVGTWRNHKRWLRDREFTATHA
jgi:hypothetical protein